MSKNEQNITETTQAVASLAKTDLHLLAVFMTVAEVGGFSAAQVSLNVGQSTISRHMADLELRLGVRLCQRGRSGFRLTHKGRIVYSAAQTLFRALEGFRSEVGSLRGRLVGELSIAVIDNWVSDAASPLPAALSALKQQGPDVQLDLRCVASDEIERALLAHQVDLGIGVFHQHHPGLSYERLCDDPTELYCGRGHPLFEKTGSITPEDLDQADYVRRTYLSEERVAPNAAHLRSSASARQLEGIVFLILSGCYIGYLPVTYASGWVRQGSLRQLSSPDLRIDTTIEIVTRRGVKHSLVAETFLNILRSKKTEHRQREVEV